LEAVRAAIVAEHRTSEGEMSEIKERFNPEPWLRSVLWLALAVALFVAIFHGNPLKISGGGVDIELGAAGIPSEKAPAPAVTPGAHAIRRDAAGTTFVSVCPPKTRAIGGSCTIPLSGTGALQNFGPEMNDKGGWQFACVWGSKVDGDALATCLPEL
jgi:hypothetical protein